MGVSQAKKTKINIEEGLFAVMNEKGEVEIDAGAPWSIVVFFLSPVSGIEMCSFPALTADIKLLYSRRRQMFSKTKRFL